MPVWLVTGGSGFLGRHLLQALLDLLSPGVDVIALGRRLPSGWPARSFLAADLNEPAQLAQALKSTAPEVVFHLAGRTPPGDPEAFYRDNTLATVRLLDGLRALDRPVRVVLVGSASELGPVAAEDLPVGEDYPCRPADGYGLSKWLATAAGLAARPPLEVVVARVFNPIGPGLPATQAFGRFAARLAEPGPDPVELKVGDLDARRDFIDVRDVARALIALAGRGQAGMVYHVGTGQSQRVGDGLARLIELCGREVTVEVDPELAAGRGRSESRAGIGRIVAGTGWRPEISWERSLDDLWDEARTARGRS
jgi:nucleoside-diphosphate-sugar epimerase